MPIALSPSSSPPLDPIAVSEDLTPLAKTTSKGDVFVDFDGQLSPPLKVYQDTKPGCGGQTWPAGLVLGKHLLRYHRQELKDARILELGSGSGLVGLAVSLGCQLRHKIILTDLGEMLPLMKRNIDSNDLSSTVDAVILPWGEPLPQVIQEQKPDVILAGECVYFEPAFPLLMQTLKDLFLLNERAVVYFCFKKRRRADMQFVKMAKKAFAVEELWDEDRPVFSRQRLFLFSFKAKIKAS